jgi:hypothetical protein
MGLDMHTKRKITGVTAKRYRAADRKGKTAILDEFTATTGYNRKYALHVLANWGSTCLARVEGKTVKLKAARPKRKRKPGGGRPKVYSDDAKGALMTQRVPPMILSREKLYFSLDVLPAPVLRA